MTLVRAISVTLVMTLCLMSAGLGVARGQAPASGQMVVCTGQGMIVVAVDAGGRPVESFGLCPDAALSTLAALEVEPPSAPPVDASLSAMPWPREAYFALPHQPLIRGARAPPLL